MRLLGVRVHGDAATDADVVLDSAFVEVPVAIRMGGALSAL